MATQVAPAHVVGEDEEDVGFRVGGVQRGQRRQQQGDQEGEGGLHGCQVMRWDHGLLRELLDQPGFDIGVEARRHIVAGVLHDETGDVELIGGGGVS